MANQVDLLPANLQNTLHQIVDRVNTANGGIRAILLSTAEGVPLGRVYADRSTPLNEDVLTNIESIWAPASKQFPLLDMGKEVKTVTAIYDHGKTNLKMDCWFPKNCQNIEFHLTCKPNRLFLVKVRYFTSTKHQL